MYTKKEKLGYVVREALDAVYSALSNDEIVSANVVRARFLGVALNQAGMLEFL